MEPQGLQRCWLRWLYKAIIMYKLEGKGTIDRYEGTAAAGNAKVADKQER